MSSILYPFSDSGQRRLFLARDTAIPSPSPLEVSRVEKIIVIYKQVRQRARVFICKNVSRQIIKTMLLKLSVI